MDKTALADELTGRAAGAGFRTCWGACVEAEGAPAFHPWRQILAELGPEARGLLLRDVESRSQLFDDVAEVLRAAAGARGLFLVLDDLHWADLPSMRLLQAVAAGIAGHRLFVLGLFRGADVVPRSESTDVLSALRRERTTSQFALAGLAPAEVAELARRSAPRPLDAAALDALVQRAEGNPLFTVEMVRLSTGAGDPERVLPRSVRDVIGRRLARVQPDVRRLLQQAAVLGRDFSMGLVAEIAEVSAARVAERLDEAIDAELVTAGLGRTTNPDGSTTRTYPGGEQVVRRPDGTSTVVTPEGTSVTTTPDGATVTSYPNGTVITRYPDGSSTVTSSSGSSVVTYPDGTQVGTDSKGGAVARNPDGTVDIT